MKIVDLDQKKRDEEKQASRDEDERQLVAGEITPLQLKKNNGFFSSLDLSRYSMVAIGGKPIKPRRMVKAQESDDQS